MRQKNLPPTQLTQPPTGFPHINTEQFINEIVSLQPAMRRMAGQLLHDDDIAADAVQETLTHLWHHRLRLSLVQNPKGFCMTSLRNRCIDILRRKQHFKPLDTLPTNTPTEEVVNPFETETQYRHLEEAVASLSSRQQQVIHLKYVKQHSSREIAQLMGLIESNVNTMMSRIYAELRERLTE